MGTLNGVTGVFPDNFVEFKPTGMLSKTKAVPAATRDRCKCECLLVILCMRVPEYDSVNSLVAIYIYSSIETIV